MALGVVEMFDTATVEEIGKLGEVGAVGVARVRRKPTFHGQMIEKGIDQLLHQTTSLRLGVIVGGQLHLAKRFVNAQAQFKADKKHPFLCLTCQTGVV